MNTHSRILAFAAANIALVLFAGCASETPGPVPATANACPQWTQSPQDSHSNADSAYLGCANALNLQHMVENPDDLKQGRDLGPADGARQAKAVKNYEDGKMKASTGAGNSGASNTSATKGSSEGQ